MNSPASNNPNNTITIYFVDNDGKKNPVPAPIGLSVLEVAHKNSISLEGACGGALACSTCHVIVEEEFFSQLPEASEDEEDMLDLAFGLKPTSRLGCQIILTKDMDGMVLHLPSGSRNIMLSE